MDFADVRAIMANAGSSLMGIGTATGKFRKLFYQLWAITSCWYGLIHNFV